MPSGDQSYAGIPLLRESNDPTRTAQTAAGLIDSTQAAQATAARLGTPYTRRSVQNGVEVQPKGQSDIIAVTAKAGDPRLAANLANTFVTQSLQVRRTVLRQQALALLPSARASKSPDAQERIAQLESLVDGKDPTISSSQPAQRPSAPEGDPVWLVVLLALLAGVAIASGTALLVELVNRRLRDESQIIEAFPLPVLARIPKLGRNLRPERLGPSLAMPPGVREAFRSLQVQLDGHELDGARNNSRVVMFASATLDDGKTSCSLGLAAAFVDAGYRVLLMDFDVRKSDVARRLGLPPTSRGVADLIDGDRPPPLKDLIVRPPQLLALQVLVAGVGRDVLLGAAFARRLPAILNEARVLADYVILDTPALGEVSDALRLITYADDVLVVGRPGRTRSDDLELTRQLIERTDAEPRGLVIVGAGRRSNGT